LYAGETRFWFRLISRFYAFETFDLAAHVDFITAHILPFWEDDPVDIDRALAHVTEVHEKIKGTFTGKHIKEITVALSRRVGT
jgi:exo-beta-1,3-glucanase (GH17 family)